MKKYMIMLIFAACATESEPESKKGACLKVQSTANYSNANCTGTILNPTTKPFCVELNDVELCKPTTQCNNGFSYVVTANAAKGSTCTAAGFPLACADGVTRVSLIVNCP